MLYRFGPFILDAGSFALQRGDTPVPLPPKLGDLLRYLVARPSALVSKEELFRSLQPPRRRHGIHYGTHEKLAASFGSPVPLYCATVGVVVCFGHRRPVCGKREYPRGGAS